jgi:hypothetical protein
MENRKSIASILLFVGSALCFFLPFVTVSCGGVKVFTLSGQQLATGASIQIPQAFGPPKAQRTDPNPLASVTALCALLGVALSLAGRKLAVGGVVTGAVGAVSLGVMGARMQGDIQRATEGLGQASLEPGFSLTVFLLLAAAAWNIYLLIQGKGAAALPAAAQENQFAPAAIPPWPPAAQQPASPGYSAAAAPPQPPPIPEPVANFGFCGDCGAKLKSAAPFCSSCGARI